MQTIPLRSVLRVALIVVMTAVQLAAQPFITPTAVFASPGSQPNSPGAALNIVASAQAPGFAASAPATVLGAGALSSTLAYECFGSTTYPAPGVLLASGSLGGASNAPFILAASVVPGSTFCGGFAGWPCLTGPLLFSNTLTPFGRYHLGAAPTVLLDGIGASAPPGILNSAGAFPLGASITINTITNGGVEFNFAVQALITDPAAPSGFTLTGCFTASQWIFYV